MVFDEANWVLLHRPDICEHSKRQVEVCKELTPNLKGGIQCDTAENRDSEACGKVSAFPCFCNVETHVCVPGLRQTKEDLQRLQDISDARRKR